MKLLTVTLLVAYAAAVVAQQSTENPKLGLTQWDSDEGVIIPSYPANAQRFLSEANKNSQTLPVSKDVKQAYEYLSSLKPKQK